MKKRQKTPRKYSQLARREVKYGKLFIVYLNSKNLKLKMPDERLKWVFILINKTRNKRTTKKLISSQLSTSFRNPRKNNFSEPENFGIFFFVLFLLLSRIETNWKIWNLSPLSQRWKNWIDWLISLLLIFFLNWMNNFFSGCFLSSSLLLMNENEKQNSSNISCFVFFAMKTKRRWKIEKLVFKQKYRKKLRFNNIYEINSNS